ncbi:zinc finger CCHC domain-containing protein 3-like [Ascaphus truei]|uniref:zinc finger CCHC domain-containing protein 3-like n=1 Tax=Ascaphus truei TaxID=8439 RepID=UPI003F5AA3FE
MRPREEGTKCSRVANEGQGFPAAAYGYTSRALRMSVGAGSWELVSKAGFTPDEILSIQDLRGGLFFVTFTTEGACRRYWEAYQTLKQEVPFSQFDVNCPIQRDERRITVTVRNPHIPGKDIATFLRRSCTVVREPSRIEDKLGYWVGKWSMVVRLWPDSEATDRLHHLPPSFSLAGSPGRIFYPDQPQTCGNCGNLGHQWKQCTLKACRNCKNTGHETKDCPRQKTCDLCGETTHMFRDCQLRVRSYAEAAAKGATPGAPLTATQKAPKKPPANQPVKAKGGKYQEQGCRPQSPDRNGEAGNKEESP